MIALVGDAEIDEGNIFEALLEGWKHGVRNTWWVVDYNRQSLDAVVREGLWERFEGLRLPEAKIRRFIEEAPFNQSRSRQMGGLMRPYNVIGNLIVHTVPLLVSTSTVPLSCCTRRLSRLMPCLLVSFVASKPLPSS